MNCSSRPAVEPDLVKRSKSSIGCKDRLDCVSLILAVIGSNLVVASLFPPLQCYRAHISVANSSIKALELSMLISSTVASPFVKKSSQLNLSVWLYVK